MINLQLSKRFDAFNNNSAINALASFPIWTISVVNPKTGDDKMPIDMDCYLNTGRLKPFSYKNQNALQPLSSFNSLALPVSNRTLRPAALSIHYFVIDVEKDSMEKDRKLLKNLPIQYSERSMHGGWHMIVKIPDEILNTPKYQPLLMDTSKKIGEYGPHTGIEFFFNRHFLTLTRACQKLPSFYTSPSNEEKEIQLKSLANLFDNVLLPMVVNKNIDNISISAEEPKLSKKISRTLLNETDLLTNVIKLSPEEYLHESGKQQGEVDHSQYEFNIVIRIVSTLYNKWFYYDHWATYITSNFEHPGLKYANDLNDFSNKSQVDQDSIIIWTAYNIANTLLEHRDKYDSFRDGLPYLAYLAQKSLEYIRSNSADNAKISRSYKSQLSNSEIAINKRAKAELSVDLSKSNNSQKSKDFNMADIIAKEKLSKFAKKQS